MGAILEKLGELGEGVDLEKIKEKLDIAELGSKFDLDRLTDALIARREKKASARAWFILGLVGVAAVAIVVALLIHRFMTPAYTDDFDDDFEDFEDDEEDEDEE